MMDDRRDAAEGTAEALLGDELDFDVLEDDELDYLTQQALLANPEEDLDLVDDEQREFAQQQLINLVKQREATDDTVVDILALMLEGDQTRGEIAEAISRATGMTLLEAESVIEIEELTNGL